MEPAIKTGWHVLLVTAAVAEYSMAETRFRKFLAMACAGWHLAAAIDDLQDWRGSKLRREKETAV